MLFILIELYILVELIHGAVYPDPDITGLSEILELLTELTLLASYNGCHDDEPRAFGLLHELIYDLVYRLR